MIKFTCMLNNGCDMLDKILDIRGKKVIGLDYSSKNKNVQNSH